MKAIDIPSFENLSQSEFWGMYLDLHNDFDFTGYELDRDHRLSLQFRAVQGKKEVLIIFHHAEIVFLEWSHSNSYLTIDQLYRGKREKGGQLVEFDQTGRGYFYLDLEEGQAFEFWSSGVEIEIRPSTQE